MARTLYSLRATGAKWYTVAEGDGQGDLRDTEVDAPVGARVVFRGAVPALWHLADGYGAEQLTQVVVGSGLAVDEVYGEDGDVVIEGHIREAQPTGTGLVGWITAILTILTFMGMLALLAYWTITGDFKPGEIGKWIKWGAIGALAIGGTLVLTRVLPRRS